MVVRSNSNYSIICTGSTMSLVSGITFGGLLAYGAYQTSANPKNFIFLFGKNHITVELENSSMSGWDLKLYTLNSGIPYPTVHNHSHLPYSYMYRCKFSPASFDGLSLL